MLAIAGDNIFARQLTVGFAGTLKMSFSTNSLDASHRRPVALSFEAVQVLSFFTVLTLPVVLGVAEPSERDRLRVL